MSKLQDGLIPRVTGQVYAPGDAGYDEEISTFNTALRHRPDLVLAATDSADVAEAVRFAAERGLRVNVQSTGHTERAVNGGLLISTRPLAGVEVDPATRIATIGAGTQWQDVIAAAAVHGLVPVAGSSPVVGVAGYLLGGGFGPLVRSHGVSSDYLAAATVVTGAGEIVGTADDPELLWALRGGKKGLGIVTRLQVRLVELRAVYGGTLFFDTDDIEKALRGWLAWAQDADPQVSTSALLARFPPFDTVPPPLRGRHALALRFVHPDPGQGERFAAPLRALAPVLLDGLGELPAPELARVHNDPTDPGPGWVDGRLLSHGDDGLATALLAAAGPGAQFPFAALELRQLGAAAARDVPEGSAVSGRDGAFTAWVLGPDPANNPADLPAGAAALWASLRPWLSPQVNVNFWRGPSDATDFDRPWTPEVAAKLAAVRRRIDPQQVFDLGI
jgi:hypothetical protein